MSIEFEWRHIKLLKGKRKAKKRQARYRGSMHVHATINGKGEVGRLIDEATRRRKICPEP